MIFYVINALGAVVYIFLPDSLSLSLSLSPSAWHSAFIFGGLFGLMAYGTYDFSNMATLKTWSWKLASFGMAWGTFVTAVNAVAGRAALMFTS
jgi:uncharacterized membrane protein